MHIRLPLPIGKFIIKFQDSKGYCIFKSNRCDNSIALFTTHRLAQSFCDAKGINYPKIEPALISYPELLKLIGDRALGDTDIYRIIINPESFFEEWAYVADCGEAVVELMDEKLHESDIATTEATLRRIDWPGNEEGCAS